jgi:hypothetical protein
MSLNDPKVHIFPLIQLLLNGVSAVHALKDCGGGKVIEDRNISMTMNGEVGWREGSCGKVVIVYVQRT